MIQKLQDLRLDYQYLEENSNKRIGAINGTPIGTVVQQYFIINFRVCLI